MRTKHERFNMWAMSALVMCQCGTKFELQDGAIEEVTCSSCGEQFRLSDYRSPGSVPPAGTGDEGEVNPNNLKVEEFEITEPENDCE